SGVARAGAGSEARERPRGGTRTDSGEWRAPAQGGHSHAAGTELRVPALTPMAADITDDIFFASIGELTTRLRAKEFSSTELTRAFCDRLEKLGPRYNALALSLRDLAIRK